MEIRQNGHLREIQEIKTDIMTQTQSPKNKRITFNVGGKLFEVYSGTLKRFPDSKLAKLTEKSDSFDCDIGEHFFDRNPTVFEAVLEACRTGELHIPRELCGPMVKRELEFWEISPAYLSPCCWKIFYR